MGWDVCDCGDQGGECRDRKPLTLVGGWWAFWGLYQEKGRTVCVCVCVRDRGETKETLSDF